ncbi:MAG: hypothetical protein WCK74_02905 [Gemmatimonadaceae bacterium]
MPVPPLLRPVLGGTRRALLVGLASWCSLLLYLRSSEAVASLQRQWSYLDVILRETIGAGRLTVLPPALSPSPDAVITTLLWLGSSVAVGWLVARRLHGHESAAPVGWAFGMAATVVPTLLLAAVGWPDGHGRITNAGIVLQQLLLVLGVWRWSRSMHTTPPRAVPPVLAPERTPWWMRVAFVLVGLYGAVVLLNGLSGVQGFDSFSDHLAVPARWLATQSLERGDAAEAVRFYPGNFELLVRWTLSLGTDRLAFLLSMGSAVAAVWMVYRIARVVGLSKVLAQLSALSAASMQVLAYQSVVVYSDSYTALCLLLATWLLLVWVREGAQSVLLSTGFGLALGMALGAKYSAGPPAVMLGMVWLWSAWKAESRMGRQVVAVSVGVLLTMGYWYVRNAVELGNPLYPLSVVGLPGIPLDRLLAGAPGPVTLWERLSYPWVESHYLAGFETGLGPIVAAVLVPALCMVPTLMSREEASLRLWRVIVLGALLVWWQSGVLVPRYGLYPLLLSCVAIGVLWRRDGSVLLGVATAVALLSTWLSVGHELVGGIAYFERQLAMPRLAPAVIDSLPSTVILNAVEEPAGYQAMGPGYRHRVITLFAKVMPADVRRLRPEYVLLPSTRDAEFQAAVPMTLVGRGGSVRGVPTGLWRVELTR